MPSHHDELLNLPSQEPLCNEGSFRDTIPTALTSGPRGSAVQQNLEQALCYLTTNYQQSNTGLMVPPVVELWHGQENTQDAQACGVPLAAMGDATALHETACESPQEWPEVVVSLPMAEATESGGGVGTIHHNPPPSSVRLLDAEEGDVGISPGERGMELEPPAGELPGELYLEIISCRGTEVCYGPYHLQYILPPPFPPHHYPAHGYANDPTIHWPPGMRGFGHHTNKPPPFLGVHETEYANASGSHELPAVRAYRQAQVYDLVPSDAGALLCTQGGLEHSAGTCQGAVLDSTDPPASNNIACTRDM
ncbi:hypothetical protein EDC04DRAFT_2603234 [Pisolithus marmoratus]|nr:hypothetical protein EDC04DRAFT_2603234 [Pisolithus marmoratus]